MYGIIDFEAASTDSGMVTEAAYLLIDASGEVVDRYHALVKPYKVVKSLETSRYVYRNVTGLSFKLLRENGVPVQQVKENLLRAVEEHPSATWLARDPKLENWVLWEWFGRDGLVREVADFIGRPEYRSRRGRPPKPASLPRCRFHDAVRRGEPHCALNDVFEQHCWLKTFLTERPPQ